MSDALFLAIAHPSRRAALEILLERGEASAGDLARELSLSASAASQHLRVLIDADLVAGRGDGRHRYYHLTPEPLLRIVAWMQGFERAWRDHPDRLGEFLAGRHTTDTPPEAPNAREETPWT